MSDDVLEPFSSKGMPDNRANNGGKMPVTPIPYSPPVGPKGLSNSGPGLGGTNHGSSGGQQGRH